MSGCLDMSIFLKKKLTEATKYHSTVQKMERNGTRSVNSAARTSLERNFHHANIPTQINLQLLERDSCPEG